MYCKYCGNHLDENAMFCSRCGHSINDNQTSTEETKTGEVAQSQTNNNNSALGTVAKILMIITCVIYGIYLIPLAWMLPMTITLCKKIDNNDNISTGFKVCTLIFCNTIVGILLLCMNQDK